MTMTNTDHAPATDARSHAPPMGRPSVDVVVPFAGSTQALRALVDRLEGAGLQIAAGDSLVVVDNRPGAPDEVRHPRVDVVAARARQSSYYARNRGAARGRGEWLLFIDADVEPRPDLVARYFEQPAADRTAVLAGAVADEPPDDGEALPPAARWAYLQASLSQENTLLEGTPYAKTANCAVRRDAFEPRRRLPRRHPLRRRRRPVLPHRGGRLGARAPGRRRGGAPPTAGTCASSCASRRATAPAAPGSTGPIRASRRGSAGPASRSGPCASGPPPPSRSPRASATPPCCTPSTRSVVWAFEVGRLAPNSVDRPATAPWRWARR